MFKTKSETINKLAHFFRCHNSIKERECLDPQLGSGPTTDSAGSGFYTVRDYQDILRAAERNRVEVIPEFDFPAHSSAAIRAMNYR